MYKKVELKNGFVGMEQDVAKVWKEPEAGLFTGSSEIAKRMK